MAPSPVMASPLRVIRDTRLPLLRTSSRPRAWTVCGQWIQSSASLTVSWDSYSVAEAADGHVGDFRGSGKVSENLSVSQPYSVQENVMSIHITDPIHYQIRYRRFRWKKLSNLGFKVMQQQWEPHYVIGGDILTKSFSAILCYVILWSYLLQNCYASKR